MQTIPIYIQRTNQIGVIKAEGVSQSIGTSWLKYGFHQGQRRLISTQNTSRNTITDAKDTMEVNCPMSASNGPVSSQDTPSLYNSTLSCYVSNCTRHDYFISDMYRRLSTYWLANIWQF